MIHDSFLVRPPYTLGPPRAAKGGFPYQRDTLAEVDAAYKRWTRRLREAGIIEK